MDAGVTVQSCGDVITGWWHSRAAKRALVAAAIPAVALYGLGDLVSGLFYEGYSYRDQAISELSAFGSPIRPLMVTVLVLHALLVVAAGVGVWRSAVSRSLRGVGLLLIPIGLVGIPNHTVFAMSSRWMEAGFNDTMHKSLTAVFVVLVAVALVLSAVAYRGWFRWYTFATLAVLMGFGAAASVAIGGIEQDSTLWAGGFERINAYSYFAWLVVLAVTVLRRHLSRGTTRKDPVVVGAKEPASTSTP